MNQTYFTNFIINEFIHRINRNPKFDAFALEINGKCDLNKIISYFNTDEFKCYSYLLKDNISLENKKQNEWIRINVIRIKRYEKPIWKKVWGKWKIMNPKQINNKIKHLPPDN